MNIVYNSLYEITIAKIKIFLILFSFALGLTSSRIGDKKKKIYG